MCIYCLYKCTLFVCMYVPFILYFSCCYDFISQKTPMSLQERETCTKRKCSVKEEIENIVVLTGVDFIKYYLF